jgi:microcystin-dependent protein
VGVSAFPGVGFLPGMVMPYAGTTAPGGWLLCNGTVVNIADYPQLYTAIGTRYNTGGETGLQFRLPNLLGRIIAGMDASQPEFASVGQSGGVKVVTLALAEMPVHGHVVTVDANNFNSAGPNDNTSDWPSDNTSDGGSGTTNWMSDNFSTYQHYHTGRIGNVIWTPNTAHSHSNRGGYASEGPWEGGGTGGTIPINIDTVDTNHWHGTGPHTHTMKNHTHTMKNHWHNVNHGHTNSVTTAGGSTAHNNLQPYLTMQYLIKI